MYTESNFYFNGINWLIILNKIAVQQKVHYLCEQKNNMNYLGFDKSEHFDRISLYHGDCMDLMKQTPDKYYDLCII